MKCQGLLSTQAQRDTKCGHPSFPTFHSQSSMFLPQGYTGSSHLNDFKPIHLEEAEATSPAAYGYYLPLWVEGNGVQGLGTGVLEGQLPMDCVPQLEEREGQESGAEYRCPSSLILEPQEPCPVPHPQQGNLLRPSSRQPLSR